MVSKAAKTVAKTVTATRTVQLMTQCATENQVSVNVLLVLGEDSVTSVNRDTTDSHIADLVSVTITRILATLRLANVSSAVTTLKGTTVMSACKVTTVTRVKVTAENVCARMDRIAQGSTLLVVCWIKTLLRSLKCASVTLVMLDRNVRFAHPVTGVTRKIKMVFVGGAIATGILIWWKALATLEQVNVWLVNITRPVQSVNNACTVTGRTDKAGVKLVHVLLMVLDRISVSTGFAVVTKKLVSVTVWTLLPGNIVPSVKRSFTGWFQEKVVLLVTVIPVRVCCQSVTRSPANANAKKVSEAATAPDAKSATTEFLPKQVAKRASATPEVQSKPFLKTAW